jgi:hypothetical protein
MTGDSDAEEEGDTKETERGAGGTGTVEVGAEVVVEDAAAGDDDC